MAADPRGSALGPNKRTFKEEAYAIRRKLFRVNPDIDAREVWPLNSDDPKNIAGRKAYYDLCDAVDALKAKEPPYIAIDLGGHDPYAYTGSLTEHFANLHSRLKWTFNKDDGADERKAIGNTLLPEMANLKRLLDGLDPQGVGEYLEDELVKSRRHFGAGGMLGMRHVKSSAVPAIQKQLETFQEFYHDRLMSYDIGTHELEDTIHGQLGGPLELFESRAVQEEKSRMIFEAMTKRGYVPAMPALG